MIDTQKIQSDVNTLLRDTQYEYLNFGAIMEKTNSYIFSLRNTVTTKEHNFRVDLHPKEALIYRIKNTVKEFVFS